MVMVELGVALQDREMRRARDGSKVEAACRRMVAAIVFEVRLWLSWRTISGRN